MCRDVSQVSVKFRHNVELCMEGLLIARWFRSNGLLNRQASMQSKVCWECRKILDLVSEKGYG